jgi:hypothetical protein
MSKMSNKTERAAAAKAKKQKIILIAGGVILLGLAAIQGPKLLGGGGQEATEPSATSTSGTILTPISTTTPGSTGTTPSGKTVGSVAGVRLPAGVAVVASNDQLTSFTLFEVKDPFLPKAGNVPAGGSDEAVIEAASDPLPADGSAGSAGKGTEAPAAPKPPALNTATIKVDGAAQLVALKGTFPTEDQAFVLVSLAKKSAKIAVAGGSFASGETVTLKVGKKVVLVNTATNVRYELLLVRTENAAAFTATDPATGKATTSDTPETATAQP